MAFKGVFEKCSKIVPMASKRRLAYTDITGAYANCILETFTFV